MTEAKFKHFCDKFVEAVFEFVATEEKKIEAEEIDKMSTPTNEVFVAISITVYLVALPLPKSWNVYRTTKLFVLQ